MSAVSSAAKRALAAVIVVGAGIFFYRAFQENWATIVAHHQRYDIPFVILSLLFALGTTLLGTVGWFQAFNGLSRGNKVTFRGSMAAVNVSGLAKYLPGKFWPFAIQAYWLSAAGCSKTLVVFVNVLNLYVSIVTTTTLGLVLLALSPARPSGMPVGLLVVVILLFDACFIVGSAPVVRWMAVLASHLTKRDIAPVSIPGTLAIQLRLTHLLAALCSSVGVYLLCAGLGIAGSPGRMALLLSASLLADVIGYLAFVTPGGLGVREGFMYLMLRVSQGGTVALVLPLASRIVGMVSDVILGSLSLLMLKRGAALVRKGAARATEAT